MPLPPEKWGAINMHIIDIDGAHGILLLPQNTMAALNGISSETGLLKISCGPCHLGRAQDWAWAQGCRAGPGTGPGQPWARAQAWARPKCHGPHGIFSSPGSELIPFRAAMVFWGSRRMPWAPSMSTICVLVGTHRLFQCCGLPPSSPRDLSLVR